MLPCLGNPHATVLEARAICDVVADDGDGRVLDILRNEAVELFLPRCVPDLHSNHLVVHVDRFRQKVDSDRCLALPVEYILRKAENYRRLSDRLVA